jgi:hypothetical protein
MTKRLDRVENILYNLEPTGNQKIFSDKVTSWERSNRTHYGKAGWRD